MRTELLVVEIEVEADDGGIEGPTVRAMSFDICGPMQVVKVSSWVSGVECPVSGVYYTEVFHGRRLVR